ncbi:hypothetical protein V3508_005108 [Serratia marcescens]|nr:hypothetical protein [Serratia marcescens]
MKLSLNYYKSPDNYRGEDVILASNDGSGGGVLPPIEPEPLACSISLTTDGVISWGTLPLSELEPGKLASASARVSCSGGTEGTATARLTFSSINGRNNVVEMKNNDGDVIPSKLVMSSTGESNIAYFTVRDGYTNVHTFHARIQPYNISTYGEFKGSGLLKVEVL